MTATTVVTATFLTTDVISKTISFTVSNIYNLGQAIFYTDSSVDLSSLEKLEKKLDLLSTIKIYDLWIQEVSYPLSSKALEESIISFQNGLEKIHTLMYKLY